MLRLRLLGPRPSEPGATCVHGNKHMRVVPCPSVLLSTRRPHTMMHYQDLCGLPAEGHLHGPGHGGMEVHRRGSAPYRVVDMFSSLARGVENPWAYYCFATGRDQIDFATAWTRLAD